MSERALSEEALLAGLRDIHLPAEAAGGAIADAAAAVAIAGLLALAFGVVLRVVSRRRPRLRERTLTDILDDLGGAPEDERRLTLLSLLKTHAPERFESLRADLYRPGAALDLNALEDEVRGRA